MAYICKPSSLTFFIFFFVVKISRSLSTFCTPRFRLRHNQGSRVNPIPKRRPLLQLHLSSAKVLALQERKAQQQKTYTSSKLATTDR